MEGRGGGGGGGGCGWDGDGLRWGHGEVSIEGRRGSGRETGGGR